MVVPFQIYRHFKGNLYLVISVALNSFDLEPTVVYKALYGDNQVWTRPLSEFESFVPEGKENPTGQKYRFQQVVDLRDTLSMCTTQNLIEELKKRPDSPFNEADVDGMNEKVVAREYVLGEMRPDPVTGGDSYYSLHSTYSNDDLEKVKNYAERHFDLVSSRTKIFKSVLVEVQSFD